ncbi:hypothetical protein [Archaeoglobus veneficus]|uniref:Uncharacterized protein n=1 Tax=Archaeoglobus veneficus (strain DSM 11195 / SNP6) TaxID=693661 RepID=F2KSI0_ARCVS|nr:hypothetical protein [Archaeoglobus veneficus]AEA48050.1 hypothetical protein Arcve_2060 [Archaeoglobus veneficus SNP6]
MPKLPACATCNILLVRGRDNKGNIINECPKCGKKWGSEIADNEEGIIWKPVKKQPFKLMTYVERHEEPGRVVLKYIEERRYPGNHVERNVIRVDEMPREKGLKNDIDGEGPEIKRMQIV